jgi:alkanesulfonate monooxygenase SsuD/methylene tetrahydromethanopterin reductase-like flavin-dependent oxidoreductase (luciferase family)
MIATIDQISQARVALNIVAGWNKPEYDALGLDLPASHEERYGYTRSGVRLFARSGRRQKPLIGTASSGS